MTVCLLKLIGLYTKRENFTICKLYLNISDLKIRKSKVHKGACEVAKEEETHGSVAPEVRKNKISKREWSTSVQVLQSSQNNTEKSLLDLETKRLLITLMTEMLMSES